MRVLTASPANSAVAKSKSLAKKTPSKAAKEESKVDKSDVSNS